MSARDILVLEVLPQVEACRQMMEQQVPYAERIANEEELNEDFRGVWDRLEPGGHPTFFQGLRLQWGIKEMPIAQAGFDRAHGVTRDRTGPVTPLTQEEKEEF